MRLGVVAARVEPCEVGVGRRDGPDVLGAVELARGVVGVAVEPDGDGPVAVAVGESVVVVPAVLAVLVAVAVGADAGEFGEGEVAGVGEFADADGAAARVERDGACRAVGDGDGLVFDVGALLDASLVRGAAFLGSALRGGDPVDREQPEVAQQGLVVDAAERGVVDDALGAGDVAVRGG